MIRYRPSTKPQGWSFEEAATTVHALHKPTWRNPKHAAQFISTLETYTFPALAKIKVGDVTTSKCSRRSNA